jgi:hypothetical protein
MALLFFDGSLSKDIFSSSSSNYRDSDSCRFFSLLKAIAKRLLLLFANAFKSDIYMGSNTEKKPRTNLHKTHTKI